MVFTSLFTANTQQNPSSSGHTSRPTNRSGNLAPRRARDSSSSSSSRYSPTVRKKKRDASTARTPNLQPQHDYGPLPEGGHTHMQWTYKDPNSGQTYTFVRSSRNGYQSFYRCEDCVRGKTSGPCVGGASRSLMHLAATSCALLLIVFFCVRHTDCTS